MKMYHLVEAESLWALSQKGAVNLPQVKTLQDRLRAAGFDPGASDGWYGKNTANAVRAYQQANGLTVDGDAGPQTLAKLGLAGANNTAPRETPPEETPPAPAPRQPAPRQPAPTRREPAQTTTRSEPAPTRREPAQTTTRSEPSTTTRDKPKEVQLFDIGNGTQRRLVSNSINEIGKDRNLNFRYAGFRIGMSTGVGILEVVLENTENYTTSNSSIYRPIHQRANRVIEALRNKLRGDLEIKVFVKVESGTPIASEEIFLDP